MRHLSVFFKFLNSHSVHTRDFNTVRSGSGIYNGSEWAVTRKNSLSFYSNPTLQNYFRMIFNDPDKILSANKLCEKFDFSDRNLVGDIGGVPFSQSWAIKTIFPSLKFVLTDYDSGSLVKHKVCPPFAGEDCDFVPFDAIVDDLTVFRECNILTMWGVDYALNDADLIRLFELVKNQKIPLLMATLDIDSGNRIRQFVSELYGRVLQVFGRSRYHGVLRNQAYIMALSKSIDVTCELVVADSNYRILRVN